MSNSLLQKFHYDSLPDGEGISQVITLLRFPMAVLILLLHSSFENELINGHSIFDGWDVSIYHHLDYLFVQNICATAVPMFFMISGYLFFCKDDSFTTSQYMSKIRKRIRTLFIPYIIWNIIICLLYLMVQNLMPSMNSGRNKLIIDYSVNDFIMMFWSMSYIKEGGMNGPMDTPLWFIRDLMMMMLASPILYWLTRQYRFTISLLTLMLYISGIWNGIPGFSPIALAFFSVGAYFAINRLDFCNMAKKNIGILSVLYSLILILLVFGKGHMIIPLWLHHLNVVIGVFTFLGYAAVLSENHVRINMFLTSSSFFIFASHVELLKVFIRLSSRTGIQNDLFYCIMYFICPLITLLVILFILKLMRIYTPKAASVLSGGR